MTRVQLEGCGIMISFWSSSRRVVRNKLQTGIRVVPGELQGAIVISHVNSRLRFGNGFWRRKVVLEVVKGL